MRQEKLQETSLNHFDPGLPDLADRAAHPASCRGTSSCSGLRLLRGRGVQRPCILGRAMGEISMGWGWSFMSLFVSE